MGVAYGNSFDPRSLSPALWLSDTGSDPAIWEDLSGNGRNATQATAENQPAIVANALNGRQVRRFDGVNDFMQILTGLNILRNVSGATAVCVWKYNSLYSGDNVTIPFFISSGSSIAGSRLAMGSNLSGDKFFTAGRRLDSDNLQFVNSIIDTNTLPFIQTAVIDYANSDIFQFINSESQGSNTSFQTNGNTSNTDSQAIRIGRHNVGNQASHIDIAEILVFPTALPASDRRTVERYLAAKWGIGFNPLSLSPALWLSDTGSDPARWDDLSGNNRHATQTTTGLRPAIISNRLAGRQVRRFDGGDNMLVTNAVNMMRNLPSVTVVVVVIPSSHAVGSRATFSYGTNASFNLVYTGFSGSSFLYGGRRISANAFDGDVFGTAILNKPYITSFIFNWANASRVAYISDGLENIDISFQTAGNSEDLASLGCRIGSSFAGDQGFIGDIAEILVFPIALSTSDRRAVERYLSQKWNIIP